MDAESLARFRALLFPADSPAALVINCLILALFLAGLVNALAAIWLLVRDRRRVGRAKGALLAPGARPRPLTVATIVKFLGAPAEGPVAQRVARVLRLRAARMGGLQPTTSSHLDRYGFLARYIA